MSTNLERCPCCGASEFTFRAVLWPELIREWQLSSEEVEYINLQQGLCCAKCHNNLRSMVLAYAVVSIFDYQGTLEQFVNEKSYHHIRLLEINEAGNLTFLLSRMPGHCLVKYPDVDIMELPFGSETFDIVIHSDTLEHVSDPIKALAECRRVLKDEGFCVFTVPVIVDRLTRSRSGLPPSYHGAPDLNREDYLVYTEYGADVWTQVIRAGFDECRVFSLNYPSSLAFAAFRHDRRRLGMKISGERYQPIINVPEHAYEHWHRYLYALQYVSEKNVLDIACGEGYGSNLLASRAKLVVGVDLSEEVIHHASSKYVRSNLEFRRGRAGNIPVEGEGIFDVIVSFETIEHLDLNEQLSFMSEVRRLLTRNGILLISTPNRFFYSDIPNYHNEYHLREFYFDDFLEFLKSSFSNVLILSQRVYPISYVWPAHPMPHRLHECQLLFCDHQFMPASQDLKQGRYLIAVCSNAVLDHSMPSSILVDSSEQAFLQRDARIRDLENQVSDLRSALLEKDEHLAKMQDALRAQEQRLAEIHQQIDAMRSQHATQVMAYEQRLAETIAHHEQRLAETIAHHEQRLAETIAHHEQQLAETTARYEGRIAELEHLLSKAEADKQAAQAQASALQAELNWERSGIGYRMLRRGRALFTSVFPHNSVQRSMYVAARRTISRMRAQSKEHMSAYGVQLPDTLTMRSNHPLYDRWLAANVPSPRELREQRAASKHLRWQPLISVIMPVYNVPADLLTRAVESVIAQSYPKWELCIVDDCSSEPHIRPLLQRLARRDRRICVQFTERNRGIAVTSNACLAMARGDFVVFLDNDDELAPHALFSVAELLHRHLDADLVYSDEDKIAPGNTREEPFFKPDFSYDLLLSNNYICHLLALRRSLVLEIGGFREGYDGAQDYDLVLRAVERTQRNKIHHIPDVLYHWRAVEGSTAANYWNKPKAADASLRLLDEHLTRTLGEGYGEVEIVKPNDTAPPVYRPRYALRRQPLVSIIIGTKDKADVLKTCVDSLAATTYPHYEVVIVNNNSCEAATLSYLESLPRTNHRIRVIDYPHPFNYSALNNFGIRRARGEVIVLLNNDTELLTPEWLDIMLGYVQQQRVGAVGVKLLYSDSTIQHAGVVVGVGGVAGHSHKYFPAHSPGYANLLNTVRNYSAVTAACMMFRRNVWEEVGGLDERLAVTFNDVDFCLRIGAAGYDIVYLPQVQLLHHESISVGRVHLNERQMDAREIEYMKQRWKSIIDNDPFYNPNLTLDTEDYAIHPTRRREMKMQRMAERIG